MNQSPRRIYCAEVIFFETWRENLEKRIQNRHVRSCLCDSGYERTPDKCYKCSDREQRDDVGL